MQYISTKKFDGTYTMNWIGYPVSTDEISTTIQDVKSFSIEPTKSIKSITNFTDIIRGETDTHYFKKYFSYSNLSGVCFSEQLPIDELVMDYCSLNELYLNLYYYRIDENTTTIPQLSINSIVIEGTYDIETTDEIIDIPDEGYILTPIDIYKIFKLSGFEIYGVNTNNLNIKYRFTQDDGRSYTPWEDLTPENISTTTKINPVRFAQVEYSIQKIDNNIDSKVYDIILLGDFQNINNHYLKTNRYGVREDCSLGTILSGGTSSSSNSTCLGGRTSYMGDDPDKTLEYNKDWITQGLSCYLSGNIIDSLKTNSDGSDATATFDPYSKTNETKITNWYSHLVSSVGNIFGHTVDYHLTDPDGNGIDKYLHEYQLFNIVDVQKLKIIVSENNFPDNQIQISEYMLDMMDTFSVIILKDEFHKVFGIEKRPAKKDIIYFCKTNRLYRVKHAQVHRDVMYMGIYYDVVLEKYEKLANEQNLSEASRNIIEPLTENNNIDTLFGWDNRQEENKIVNKQLKPITHEVYRLNLNKDLEILKRDIYNSLKGTKIANTYYNLTSLTRGITGTTIEAISYSYPDNELKVSDNRAFSFWVNFNNSYEKNAIIDQEVFNSYHINPNEDFKFIINYDEIKQRGYKVTYKNNNLILSINELEYTLSCSGLTTNIWYGVTINLDQRQRKISLDIYKRNYDYKITMFNFDPNTSGTTYDNATVMASDTTGLTYYIDNDYLPVKNNERNIHLESTQLQLVTSIEYENIELNKFSIDKTIKMYASNTKITNIRIFSDVIPDISKSNLLTQRIVQDSQYLILADNASKKLFTENIKNRLWE